MTVSRKGIPFLPHYDASLGLEEWELPLGSEVLYYGGSFRPWHPGHEACLKLAPKNYPLLIILDCNPQKQDYQIDLKLAQDIDAKVAELGFPFHTTFTGFMEAKTPNPTINWLRFIKKKRPDLKNYFLMGFDSFKSLPGWIEAQELIPMMDRIYVVSRLENQQQQQLTSDLINVLFPKLEVIFLGHHPFEHFSSTKIREEKK
jgi:nicotinate-nucleotide adenylyltransferase